MNHQVPLRDYRRVMGGTVRKLPDGRRLVTRINQTPTVVDEEGHEIEVSGAEFVALTAVSEMSFPKKLRSKDRPQWTDRGS